MRVVRLSGVLAALLLWTAPAQAELQLKPFAGVTFGGGTTLLVDLEHAVGSPNFTNGLNTNWLGEVIGFEGDVALGPGFFDKGDQVLVFKSQLITLTGNVIVALPRRMAEYGLRPYFVAGAGIMHGTTTTSFSVLELSRNFAALDFGGGATGFFSDSFGLNWDVRQFRTVGASYPEGTDAKLSFWRAAMALVYRY
jgi:hypothetical protein